MPSLFPVSCVHTGVLGDTGIETCEIIKGIVEQTKPSCVIAVDALAAGSAERLGTTIQFSDSGIFPGSGVGNHRHEISKATLGVPVVAVDDGVGTKEEALSILSLMEDEGVKTVWCTPHFMEDVPNKTSDIREKFETLKSEWAGSIELKLASENMLDNLFKERLETRDFLFHGDGKLLVETSTWAAPMDFWDMIDSILVAVMRISSSCIIFLVSLTIFISSLV